MPTLGDVASFFNSQLLGNPKEHKCNLEGKTIVITGANTGLGYCCAQLLAQQGVSNLILACRSISKGEAAREQILSSLSKSSRINIQVWEVDLSSYASVLSFSQRIQRDLSRLDGFLANAGVELRSFELAEGVEQTLTVNVLSTFAMASAVLPKLEETVQVHGTTANLTFLGSAIHFFAPVDQIQTAVHTNLFNQLSKKESADMANRYCLSKFIEHLCFNEFVERLSAREKPPNGKDLFRNAPTSAPRRMVEGVMMRTALEGSWTLVHAITAGPETNGKYLSECKVKQQSAFVRSATGEKAQKKLWKDMVELVKERNLELAMNMP